MAKAKAVPKIDASILGFAPKGAFYNPENMQMKKMQELWEEFFKFDRTIFALSTILPGTAYSKGQMSRMLLTNPVADEAALVPYGLDLNFEYKIMLFNLLKETPARSLKSLMMLSGLRDKKTRSYTLRPVNNARTRRLILDYIFNRDDHSLDELAVKFKDKLKKLIRHALGKQNLHKILNGDMDLFKKYIGRYNMKAWPIVLYVFGKDAGDSTPMLVKFFPKTMHYCNLRMFAEKGEWNLFLEGARELKLPPEVLMGFRNFYKLPIEKKDIYESSKMSERQKLQSEAAVKRAGGKVKVDYMKQDIYDLWKALYFKLANSEKENFDKIIEAITKKAEKKAPVDFGKTVVLFDCSYSMRGSTKRPMHPFLTGLSTISTLQNVEKVIYVGGTFVKAPSEKWPQMVIPHCGTNMWKPLLKAVEHDPETIMVITDGYENALKGMFEHVHKHLKKQGYKYNLVQVNPVFAAEVSGVRTLVKDEPVLPVTDYRYLETNFIFGLLQTHADQIKQLLASKYKTLVLKEADGKKIEGASKEA